MDYILENAPSSEMTLNTPETPVRIGTRYDGWKTINVMGVHILLPKPPGKTQVEGYNKTVATQVWTRFDFKKLKAMDEEKRESTINDEYKKIL